jgi:hypothetical protein
MKEYKPSNRVAPLGVGLLILALLGALALGWVLFVVSEYIYLVFLFPVLAGIAQGLMVERAVKSGRVRSPVLAGLVGLLAGALIYGCLHYLEYQDFRAEVRNVLALQFESEGRTLSPGEVEALVDWILISETGKAGFQGFMAMSAAEGVSIGRVLGDQNIRLASFWAWAYWLVEMAVVAGMAGFSGWKAARAPYCESCEVWYGQGRHLGGVEEAAAGDLERWLQVGSFDEVGRMLSDDTGLPSLEVYVAGCEGCGSSDSHLSLQKVYLNRRGKVTTQWVRQGMIEPGQVAALEQGAGPGSAILREYN